MWSLRVVVTHVHAQDPLELSPVEDQQPVEAFASDATDPALDMRRSPLALAWRLDDLDSFAGEDGVEVEGERAVTVVGSSRGGRSRDPRDPSAGLRACCNIQTPSGLLVQAALDSAAAEADEEQHVQPPQQHVRLQAVYQDTRYSADDGRS